MLSIKAEFEFDAAHFLPNHKGLCHNLHGHHYFLTVEIQGQIISDPARSDYGMIMDFGDLKKIVKEAIIDVCDHNCLNNLYDNPTAEKMIEDFSFILMNRIDEENRQLIKLELYETPKACSIWRRDA